jgi:nitrous oxide reductase accessory protein NosL
MGASTGRIRSIEAADFRTGALIDARTAFYLESSDIPGVMTYTSRIAFPSQKDAQAFRRKHGGRVISFDEAVRNQLKDNE